MQDDFHGAADRTSGQEEVSRGFGSNAEPMTGGERPVTGSTTGTRGVRAVTRDTIPEARDEKLKQIICDAFKKISEMPKSEAGQALRAEELDIHYKNFIFFLHNFYDKTGFDVNAPLTKDGETLLILAVRTQNRSILKAVKDLPNIDPNKQGTNNFSALKIAIANVDADSVEILLDIGADPYFGPHKKGKKYPDISDTSLHYAHSTNPSAQLQNQDNQTRILSMLEQALGEDTIEALIGIGYEAMNGFFQRLHQKSPQPLPAQVIPASGAILHGRAPA